MSSFAQNLASVPKPAKAPAASLWPAAKTLKPVVLVPGLAFQEVVDFNPWAGLTPLIISLLHTLEVITLKPTGAKPLGSSIACLL